MKRYRLEQFKDGWFLGNFSPSVRPGCREVEVACKRHAKGEPWPAHFQRRALEMTVLLHGRMRVNGVLFREGDILVIEPMEVAKPIFLEDCEVCVVKLPSLPGDKVEVCP